MKMKRNSIEANKKSAKRRPVKAAESYGWVVDENEAWEAYEFACDYFGKENLDDQIVSSLSVDELASSLAFIFRMNDFREWEERNEEDIEESRKLRGRKSIKSSKRNTRRPVKAARITTDFSNFKPWSGAVDTWNELEKWDKIDLLEQILDDTYYNEEAGEAVMSETELNDLLWFEPETVYEWVGLYYNDETGEVSDEPFDSEDEGDEYDEDEDIEESRKLRGRKAIKSNRRINKRRPVKAAESTSGDMFEQVFAESMSNLNDIFKGNMTFDATVGSVYGASHDKIYPGDGVDFLYNLRDLAEANEGQNIMDYISSYLSDPLYLAIIDDTIDSYIGEHISGEDMNNIDPTVAPGFIDEWYDMFYADCDKLATQVADDICRYLTSFAMSVEDIDAEMLNHPDEDDMIEDDFLIWRINK